MSIFSGLWAGAKLVLGLGTGSKTGSDNVMEIARGVGNFIDEQNFEPQEKAVYNAQLIDKFAGFMESTVSENSQRSKARREVALLVIRWELLMITLSAGLYRINQPWAEYIYKIATDDPVGYLVLGIGAFFFGAHIVRAVKK